MKHIFIINPVAGSGKARGYFMPRILSEIQKYDVEYKVHITTKVGDAERFVKRLCSFRKDPKQTLRFYACGGDGTLNEVLNGLMGYQNVQLACIPAGSGNDFVRNFGDTKKFFDIKAQLSARPTMVDSMAFWTDDGRKRLGLNLINMGVDTEAARYMEMVKQKKILQGTSAYIFGAACAFFQLRSYDIDVWLDDREEFGGAITLLALGNGTTYGGGFRATPEARVDDGLIDMCLVKKIDRRQFLKLIGPYKKGEHIRKDRDEEIIRYKKGKAIRIRSEAPLGISVDGELIHTTKLRVEVQPKSVCFVVPGAL